MNQPTVKEYNPRYIAYARSQGRGPEEQKAHDREAWPGGYAAGFMLWLREQWNAWSAETGERRLGHHGDGAWTDKQHEMFDAWLQEQYQ